MRGDIMILTCDSLVISDIEHISVHLLTICMSLENVYSVPLLIF